MSDVIRQNNPFARDVRELGMSAVGAIEGIRYGWIVEINLACSQWLARRGIATRQWVPFTGATGAASARARHCRAKAGISPRRHEDTKVEGGRA